MVERDAVSAWLDAYVQAWKSYDRAAISALFSEDAVYYDAAYSEGIRGREAIVESWLQNRDAPGTYDAHYEPVLIEGERAMTNGRSRYFEQGSSELKTEWDNVFLLTFDGEGRCKEYREWFMKRPS